MNTARRVAGNTLVQVAGKLVVVLLSLATLSIILRTYGAELQGKYLLAATYAQFTATVAEFGLGTWLVRAFSRRELAPEVRHVLTFRLAVNVAALAVAGAAAFLLPYDAEMRRAIGLGLVSAFFLSLNPVAVAFYQSRLRMHIPVVNDALSRVVTLALTWAVVAARLPFLYAVGVVIAGSLAGFASNYLGARSSLPYVRRVDRGAWKAIAVDAAPIWVSSLLVLIYFRIDTLLLSVLPLPGGRSNMIEVGYYATAYRFLESLVGLPGMFLGVVLPLLTAAETDLERVGELVRRSVYAISLGAAPLAVGVVCTAGPLVALFFPDYGEAAVALRILIWAFFLSALASVFLYAIVGVGQQRRLLGLYLLVAPLNVALNLVVIPRFGFRGAAYVTVISEALVLATSLRIALRLGLARRPFSAGVLKTWAAAAAMAAVLPFLPPTLLARVPAGVAVYFAVLALLRGYDRDLLRRLVARGG